MRFLDTFFDGTVMAKYLPDLLSAIVTTLWLSAIIVVGGLALGLALACLRTLGRWYLTLPIVAFADIGRALPPLVVILIFYFGLPGLGINLSGPMVLILVLGGVLAAFAEEIFWAGLTAVTKGQWEAGRATGLSFAQTLFEIALPQAIRMGIPPLVNRALAITKMTALGSVIGVKEILAVSSSAQSFSGSATPLTMAALAYLAIFLPVVILSRLLERRYAWAV
ncbi:polar amino acid ABC transporter permease (plasmid) [Alloyangia pacifica]|uniref:Polar amino acid ABC transporter permease n=1 Tax=Alloyangia pacifica TaxID=311180 RepID=A0A2U8HLP9_9RHOB|nr:MULTISPECIES: ABC transporter permease subunit [Roseobacteraceae]AWI86817.1 polar amino acid ABC transporter permease [Alloyangia pacifica]NDV51293.1 ABC transporter permease subunit [Salipiger sp. PrR003]NDW31822.1 ABC transporter permease subunit [Salipiger sp. PrR007]